MSEVSELDRLIEKVVDLSKETISSEASQADREELMAALRDKKKREVVKEIREEYKQELIQEINDENEKEANRQKIKDLKKLMWEGFVLAFMVGLAVNQATEIIDYVKGVSDGSDIRKTIFITVILILFCIVTYIYTFFENAISLLKEKK